MRRLNMTFALGCVGIVTGEEFEAKALKIVLMRVLEEKLKH